MGNRHNALRLTRLRPLALLLPLVLAGCNTAPNSAEYAPKSMNTGEFVSHLNGQTALQPLPNDWWQLYQDERLNQLVRQALNANNDLRVAEANLRRTQALLQQTSADRLPATTLSAGATYGDATQGASDDQWSETAGLSVAWEADFWGRIRQAIDAAEADVAAEQAARDMVRVTVAAETTRAYLNLCAYGNQLNVVEASLANSKTQRDIIAAQFAAGTVTESALASAEAVVATVQAQLPIAHASKQNALFELAALLGLTPAEAPQDLQSCTLPPQVALALPVGDGTELLRRRPDLRQAEQTLAADIVRIGVAMADLYPRISLGASANYLQNDVVSGSDSLSYGIGPLISWNFPNTLAARARLAQAKAQAQVSVAAFDGLVVNALKEVEQALTSLNAVTAQQQSLARAEQQATRAYNLDKVRFDVGAIAHVDLLVSQRNMLDSRTANAQAQVTLTNAQVNLFKALGGGWQQAAGVTVKAN
ncbi:efflux transporter outer membrane subunit [Shewanella avicenniae]|uniref:Efflux transporter outer membrane subunit n=1 Tax=Shewanella avicenniae TaxID=2814294 RepID=A0ABX7QWP1_9GAMM|nr:efflux transporter outer membrane subunit [Shewanella avicenniae]QSX35248.1 efflux transporter outer membrane subunit [Shewanella avicenniae]